MTEEEAKTKWCPMVRTGVNIACNTDSQTPNAEFYMCRASGCMMWVPQQEHTTGDYPIARVETTGGYCGLAK